MVFALNCGHRGLGNLFVSENFIYFVLHYQIKL